MKNFSWKSKGQTLLWLEKKLLYYSISRNLVFSLYKMLITQKVWCLSIAKMEYSKLVN